MSKFRAGTHLLVTDIKCVEFAQNQRDLCRFHISLVSAQSLLVEDDFTLHRSIIYIYIDSRLV